MSRPAISPGHATHVVAFVTLCAAIFLVTQRADAARATDTAAVESPVAEAAALFDARCSTCHGDDGRGVRGRGPTLEHSGAAAADFVLRTGRMPMADPDMQAHRGRTRFSNDQVDQLVAFVAALGDGPDIPDVEPASGDPVRGGQRYRLQCAACHVASGTGAVIGSGRTAPSLDDATPRQIGEAVAIGPGAMPVFAQLSAPDVDSIAAYVGDLQDRDTTGPQALGGVGPVAEGLAAWLLGVAVLVALTRWIGQPRAKEER